MLQRLRPATTSTGHGCGNLPYLRGAVGAYSGVVAPDPGSCSIGRSQLRARVRSFLLSGAQTECGQPLRRLSAKDRPCTVL
jgi:hypothetical protein